MTKSPTKLYSRIMLLLAAMCLNIAIAGASKTQKVDSTYLRLLRAKKEKNFLKTNFHVSLPAVKPYNVPVSRPIPSSPDDKLLTFVQVYPNPMNDQINVKYTVARDANVTIKIMDVLGNEVVTLVSNRVSPGEQKCSRDVSNLNRGYYFVRVTAGTESVIKRISIL